MNKAIYLSLVLVLMGWSACQDSAPTTSSTSSFELTETGLDFTNQLHESETLNIIQYLYYYNGGGVAIGDIDNDGLEDVYFTANQGPDKLYRNIGNLQFEDISTQAGIQSDASWSSGVAMEDLNNDGFLDIHVCKVGVGLMPEAHNLVYLNQGDGTFLESAQSLGLAFQGFSTQACFLDYDQDGDLDMYLLNHNVHSVRSYGNTRKRAELDPLAGDRFYENRLNETAQTFVDVTAEVGIYSSPLGYGLAVTAADINGDGWTDLYVGNDFHENDYLYLNNGDGTFTESIAEWTDHTTQFSMGVDVADLNNDQLPDLFSTDMLPFAEEVYLKSGGEDTDQLKRIKEELGFENQYARNHLQINTGLGNFIDLALQTRTFATDWSWAPLLQDFDNNGLKDIFITNGIAKRPNDLDYINYLNSEAISGLAENDPERTNKLIAKLPEQPLQNFLFRQAEPLSFSVVDASQVGRPAYSNGAAFADLDDDGLLEVITNNINSPASVLRFDKAGAGHYLTLALADPSGHTTKGTKVYVHLPNGQTLYQEMQTVKGYQSSSTHRLHLGLGEAASVDSLVVVWPDRTRQRVMDVEVDGMQTITKADNLPLATFEAKGKGNFNVLPIPHQENPYYDDEHDKLIPERLSREGPAVLHEDLNGDGIKDLLLGGAHGQPTRLLQGKSDGSFQNLRIEDFLRDARYEDVSAATIDFDGDGDRDLYVVSGGNGAKELDKVLEDRLYLNNGNMDFRRIPLSLPHTNGSVVQVADYDGDGYEDIFVGARSIPGAYGLSPYSFVLKNMEGMGVDVAYKHRFGMVTDARWIDYDGDLDEDLILCGDWMPITIIENQGEGVLNFLGEESGFPQLKGFWKTLEFADFNGDGKPDILVGNLGTNSLMQASVDEPIQLYLGDFDENGYTDPVVFFFYFDRYVPLGSKDKYLSQLPGMKKRFVSYDDFAQVSNFEALLPEAGERLVETKTVTELRSMLFLSSEEGYEAVPLPTWVQALSIQDFYITPDQTAVYFLGGNQGLAAVRANAADGRMGILTNFAPKNQSLFTGHWLSTPSGLSVRKLVPLNNGQGIIVTNDNYPYLVDLQ